jgi:hypothetical protein
MLWGKKQQLGYKALRQVAEQVSRVLQESGARKVEQL